MAFNNCQHFAYDFVKKFGGGYDNYKSYDTYEHWKLKKDNKGIFS